MDAITKIRQHLKSNHSKKIPPQITLRGELSFTNGISCGYTIPETKIQIQNFHHRILGRRHLTTHHPHHQFV